MPDRAYTLSDEYKDTFVGGHIMRGVSGESVDLKALLEENNGEIITDDPVFQSVLENYHGATGLVFNVAEVDGEERRPVQAANGPPIEIPAPPAPSPNQPSSGAVANMPPAEHGEASEYSNMPDNELRDVINERGLKVPANAKTETMVAALEQDDATRAANPQ